MDTSDLANRMKDYEKRNRYYLQKRMPVIIRLDMRAGHSFTKGFQRPFDEVFMKSMQETAKFCDSLIEKRISGNSHLQKSNCCVIIHYSTRENGAASKSRPVLFTTYLIL